MPDQKLQALFNERLQASAFASRRWVIAFSGGLDSTVLLHLCAQAVPPQSLRAIHVDHGLQDSSHQWATHCRAVCEALGVACQVVAVKPDKTHPVSKGYACIKGAAIGELHHDPDRVNHPLKKVGGEWQRISWSQAGNSRFWQ